MSNTSTCPSSTDDYYTLEMLQEIWHPDWFHFMRSGQWHSGKGEPLQHISPQYQHYFPYACHSCKRGSINVDVTLSTCSGCRVLSYCSRKCQVSDWKYHKSWCQAFQGLCKSGYMQRAVKYDSINDWRADSMTLVRAMVTKLGGFNNMARHSTDIQIVGLQPRCRKCFQAGFKIDPESKKTRKVTLCPCPHCMGVALCEPCLAEEEENKTDVAAFHRDSPNAQYECDQHLLSISLQGMIVEQGNPLGMPSDTDCNEYWRPKDWREYFATKRTDFEIPEPMFNLAPIVAFLSAAHSPMLTIQHVLGLSRNGDTGTAATLLSESDRTTKKSLVIHFCGANSSSEFMMPGRYVEMIRLNPHLTTLELHLVGPELDVIKSEHDMSYMQQIINKESIRPSCKIVFQTHAGLYHEVMDSGELPVPDVVMCCHSGIHDPGYTDMWQPTIEYLIASNYPVIFTGYTHDEVVQDAKLVRTWGGRIVVEPTPNPFRALWPSADPNRETSEFTYNHASFMVLQGSS